MPRHDSWMKEIGQGCLQSVTHTPGHMRSYLVQTRVHGGRRGMLTGDTVRGPACPQEGQPPLVRQGTQDGLPVKCFEGRK